MIGLADPAQNLDSLQHGIPSQLDLPWPVLLWMITGCDR